MHGLARANAAVPCWALVARQAPPSDELTLSAAAAPGRPQRPGRRFSRRTDFISYCCAWPAPTAQLATPTSKGLYRLLLRLPRRTDLICCCCDGPALAALPAPLRNAAPGLPWRPGLHLTPTNGLHRLLLRLAGSHPGLRLPPTNGLHRRLAGLDGPAGASQMNGLHRLLLRLAGPVGPAGAYPGN